MTSSYIVKDATRAGSFRFSELKHELGKYGIRTPITVAMAHTYATYYIARCTSACTGTSRTCLICDVSSASLVNVMPS